MIILEGADAVGKTTFAQKIAKILQARHGVSIDQAYGHMSRPEPTFDHVGGYMERVGLRVQDRFHLGSIVYGCMLGSGTYPSHRQMLYVQRYLRWRGCLVVVMGASREWLRDQLARNVKKEMYKNDQILDVNDLYVQLTKQDNDGVPYSDIAIDVTDGFPDDRRASEIVDEWSARWFR